MRVRGRRGFTLLEMSIVLAIMAIASLLVIPAVTTLGQTKQRQTADELLSLLHGTRKIAIDSNASVTLVIDPKSGDYRVDSSGVSGAGVVEIGRLDLSSMETLVTTYPRLRWVFRPTGAGLGDTVRVRGVDSTVVVTVDPWSGVAYAGKQ